MYNNILQLCIRVKQQLELKYLNFITLCLHFDDYLNIIMQMQINFYIIKNIILYYCLYQGFCLVYINLDKIKYYFNIL